MTGTNSIINDPLFVAVVTRAKAAAREFGLLELDAEMLLVGFHMLLRDDAVDSASPLHSRADAIAKTVGDRPLPSEPDLVAAAAMRLPLRGMVREILARRDLELLDLIDALVAAVDRARKTTVAARADPLLDSILARAAAALAALDVSHITTELFALSAGAAYLAGEFRDRPGLSVHMATNMPAFEALLEARGLQWKLFENQPHGATPLSEALRGILASPQDESSLLLAINAGASKGQQILQQRNTAIHEAGHAVIAFLLRPQVPITQISIVREMDSAGHVAIDSSAPYLSAPSSRSYFFEDTCICLAGAIAQQIEFGNDKIDEGAQSDLDRATRNVWTWVAVMGLDPQFGPINLETLMKVGRIRSGFLFDRAQQRLQEILLECATRTRALLEANWHHVQSVTTALLERKTLDADELMQLLLDKGLAGWPGVHRVQSLPEHRTVHFAETAGVQMTEEGPVRYQAGDAIVTGAAGERWPIARTVFEERYGPAAGVRMGDDGVYQKHPRAALALQLREARNLVLSDTRGVLSGVAGDWIVDHGDGDLAVVSADRFEDYYRLMSAEQESV